MTSEEHTVIQVMTAQLQRILTGIVQEGFRGWYGKLDTGGYKIEFDITVLEKPDDS